MSEFINTAIDILQCGERKKEERESLQCNARDEHKEIKESPSFTQKPVTNRFDIGLEANSNHNMLQVMENQLQQRISLVLDPF
ncbi:protein VTE6, chloroplastic-like isoform X1 [Gossypium australe]|uniref:Protein VTE6, chloroplastic-like isoform X1 n=1 Tax=Gossypium australe TaxID=47621 RepID=A0A5B6VTI6_9ROSI|nr:protein VTE6, chloroplastic-like isoform X1 [Gossypium australe]